MTDDMIPTPYGVLVDVATGEPIGPATAEQHAARSIPGAPLLTLGDGRQADVIGGPLLKDCGHSEVDHEEAWQSAKRFTYSILNWLRSQDRSGDVIDLDPQYESGLALAFNKVCLVATAGSLSFRAGFPGTLVENTCRAKDSPIAGLTVHHVMRVAAGRAPMSDKVFDLIGVMDMDEMITTLELGASAADHLGLSPDDLRAFIMTEPGPNRDA